MTAFSPDDLRHMRRALALAERGRGTTRPNPFVGAVLTKGGRVVATGFTQPTGRPHAEADALAKLGGRAPGATLYVTLEPCCHTGRAGPCAEAVIAAGIKRVVVGCQDENPIVAGRGLRRLRKAGITVEVGCLEGEARAQNRAFFRWVRDGRPHVVLKAAASLDGFIAPGAGRAPGAVHWLTGPAARAAAHELRARQDAILVGAGTVRADDPRLTVRQQGRERRGGVDPLRVVIDGALSTPPGARLLREPGVKPPLIVGAAATADDAAGERRRAALIAAGAEVVLLPAGRNARIAPARVLRFLAREKQVQSLLLEGGSQIHAAFIAARLVDEVALFFAPQLLGGGVPVAAGPGLRAGAPLLLGALRVIPMAGDILVSADVIAEAPVAARQPRRR